MNVADFPARGLLQALAQQPPKSGGSGRAMLFLSARRNEAVTSATAAAVLASSGSAYAMDLDLTRGALAKSLSAAEALGPRIDGRLNGMSFFTARTAGGQQVDAGAAFSFHRLGRRRAYVGMFDLAALPKGARATISSDSAYWDAARLGGATVFLAAPSLDRSTLALRIGRHMEAVVLCVGDEPGAAPAAQAAKEALVGAGANLVGLVYTGAPLVLAIGNAFRKTG